MRLVTFTREGRVQQEVGAPPQRGAARRGRDGAEPASAAPPAPAASGGQRKAKLPFWAHVEQQAEKAQAAHVKRCDVAMSVAEQARALVAAQPASGARAADS